MALIHSDQDRSKVGAWLNEGRISALRNVPPLTPATVERSTRIVGMMGAEPFMQALDGGAQVVLAARASDAASWAACAMSRGLPPAPSWYAGKMLECGTASATPKGHDCLIATVRPDHLEVEPVNPARRCTPCPSQRMACMKTRARRSTKNPAGCSMRPTANSSRYPTARCA